MGGRFALPPAVPPAALPLRSACLSAVLPLRHAGLPPPFCAIYKDACRRPRPCRPACSCRLPRLPRLPPSCSPPPLLAFCSIRHKYVRFFGGTERRKRTPFAYRGIPVYANTSLRCLLAKFFIFIFLFWSTESNP